MTRLRDVQPYEKSLPSQVFSGFGYAFLFFFAFFIFTAGVRGGDAFSSVEDQISLIPWIAFIAISFCLAHFRPPLKSQAAWVTFFAFYILVAIGTPWLSMS